VRVLLYRDPGAFARSQVEPFFREAALFARILGAQIRCRPVADFLDATPGPRADVILLQPWFTRSDRLARALEALRRHQPDARLVVLDCFAHNDLRLGAVLDPHIHLYLKKSIFRDRQDYLRPRRGDTNLTEYYGDLYGIAQDPVDWQVPASMLDKLRLFPNFLTHGRFATAFTQGQMPPRAGRRIDVQSRLGSKGGAWYAAMRADAQARIEAIDGLTLSPPGKLDLPAFMAELENSRLCFSPFGYGELCWRDIEAFQTGAVLVKQDMSHLQTLPDLYEPGVTYLPVAWDFSDLETVVRGALADEARMETIARTAWARCADYLRQHRFVDDMACLFA
jgi:hypothetical protein